MSNFSNFFSSDFYSDGHAFHKSPRKKRSTVKKSPAIKKKSTTTKEKSSKKSSKKSTKESSKKNAMGTSKKSAPVYQNYIFKKIQKSKETPSKKYEAIFQHYAKKDKLKVVAFGSINESDYTQHKDKNYRNFYLEHNKIDENNLMSPKTLEQMILWNKPSFKQSVEIYKKKWESKSKEL